MENSKRDGNTKPPDLPPNKCIYRSRSKHLLIPWLQSFLEFFCFFDDPADVGNLISGSSAFSKTRLNIRKFTVHVLLKPGLENFDHYFTSM